MIDLADVKRFYELTSANQTHEALVEALQEISERMGFRYFAMIHHIDLRRSLSPGVEIFNYPDAWVDFFRENQLFSCDPIHRASHTTAMGFRWGNVQRLIRLTPSDESVFSGARACGLGEGFTIPANIPGETSGSCSFVMGDGEAVDPDQLPFVQLVGSIAFEAARRLAGGTDDKLEIPRLTRRQAECTVLVARGKTDWEIGRILGVSEETVTQHIKDARERYDVPKRTSLTVRALFDGSISFADILSRNPPFRG